MSKLDLSIIVKFVDKATQPIRQFQQNVQNTNQSIDRLTHSIDRLERSLNGGRSVKQYSRNLQVGSSNVNQHSGALNTMHNGYDRVANVIDKVRNKTQAWSDSLKANRAQMREEFKSLAMNSVIAGAGLYQFLKPAVDFEKSMSNVQSVLDLEKQSKAMQQLTADARKLGASSSFSPSEAAQAQYALGSGGFNADQIHKALGGTLQLAEAGKIEIERAAQIAVGSLNGFGLAADEIGRVNDVFLKGTNLTATSVDGLGETMKYVAPIAKAYGASIEQATAMTGLLGNNNILDTQAGTSLRSIMTRFAGPPKEATKAFAKLKIETKDNNGNLRDMSDILAEVNKATKNMGSGERLDIFKDIAGQEAVSAFAVLVDQSALLDKNSGKTVNKIKELTKELENSKGAAARAAAILKDNLAGDIEQLGGSIQDLSISVLNALGTDIRGFVTGLGAFIDKIKVWVDANPELVRTIGNLAMKLLMFKVAMLGVRYTGNLLFGTIFSMVAGITKFALFMWVATKVLGKFGIGMPSRLNLISIGVRLLGNAFIFLSRQALPLLISGLRTLAVAMMTNPITLVIALVAGLALAIWKYWGPIKAFFVGFWDGLKIGLAPLIDSLSSAWSSLKTTMSPLLPLWNGLVNVFNLVKDAISGFFTPFQATNSQLEKATANGQSFGMMLGTIIGVFTTAFMELFTIVGTVIGNTVGVLVTTFSNLPAFFNNIWTQIKTAFSGGIAGIGALIINWSPIGLFYSAFAAVLSWFGIDLPAKFTGFGAMILDGLKNGILSKVQAVKDALSSAVTGVIDKAKSILDIHSPSRVFAEIGDFTMQGMAVGLLNSSDLPIKALDQTHQKIVQTDIARPNIRSSQPVRAKSNSAIQVAGDTVTIQVHVAPGQNIQQIQSMLENMLNKREREKMARVRSSFKDQE
ncbi:phage tail tape measure protein [Acinetobacter ursingii]|uniref:phage tail tape measure protein n=1 Tax=Acinetobacter ursingii TaxID=108980 RepID=UPI000CF1F797|nr:phage tail tape measure protein [Acinetobacter ursingii]PPZ93764.1 phage tail tape measure protein [Acinetobacter ursingii]